MNEKSYQGIIAYHDRTKHDFGRFAKSLGYMDWKNQPNPFRYYEGCESIILTLLQEDPQASYQDLYRRESNEPKPFSVGNIAAFLELSLGLSAWKSIAGSRWSLRMNPSSGNLHPTECHLILPQTDSSQAGIFHYNSLEHSLELRAEVPNDLWEKITRHFGTNGFLVALSSIFWREAWKYGERAFRYCNHDVGHALAGMSFSANLQGWQLKYLNGVSDEQIDAVLAFDRVNWMEFEEEYPELLCFVYNKEVSTVPRSLSNEIVADFSHLSITGEPNILSKDRVHWQVIDEVARLTKKPVTAEIALSYSDMALRGEVIPVRSAAGIIRRRRSAVAFAGERSLGREQFFAMLDKTIPRNGHAPFDVELSVPSIHLLIFVHNVEGLQQGLYFFLRDSADINRVKSSSRDDLLWKQIEQDFPLYLLKTGNFRRIAARVSCDQEIAGYGVFSLGMIARFRETIREEPHKYRHLFWETGMIGQVLYLEAEAHGFRGTGIGCFYDDPVHEILGLSDNFYQSMYHFTVGDPIEDARLTTHAPYIHLEGR